VEKKPTWNSAKGFQLNKIYFADCEILKVFFHVTILSLVTVKVRVKFSSGINQPEQFSNGEIENPAIRNKSSFVLTLRNSETKWRILFYWIHLRLILNFLAMYKDLVVRLSRQHFSTARFQTNEHLSNFPLSSEVKVGEITQMKFFCRFRTRLFFLLKIHQIKISPLTNKKNLVVVHFGGL
jgi:hypothetical protein